MIEYITTGGPVMLPIALCSVVAMALFFERLWVLRISRVAPAAFVAQVKQHLIQREHDAALKLCRTRNSPVARILSVAIEHRLSGRDVMKERLEELGRREAAELERGIPVVGTIASISPLLGLLGTVGGMILTFQMIQDEGMGNVGNLAGGISQALVTTFAGLTVGIPAVMANRYLLSLVDGLLLDLEETALDVIDLLVDQSDSR